MEHSSDAKPDRLSDLPDCLLHDILSLSSMDARKLVQTSTLSRRWCHTSKLAHTSPTARI